MTDLIEKDDPQRISTKELGASLKVTPQSIYKRLCVTGSYWGIHPAKLPNGRLLWPADTVEQLKEAHNPRETEPAKTDGAGGWDRQFYWDTCAGTDAGAEVSHG